MSKGDQERHQMSEQALTVANDPKAGEQSVATVILAALRDPSMDPARLREFLAAAKDAEEIQLRRDERRAKQEYNSAWAAMRPELPFVSERGLNTFTGNHYAKWDDIHRACMPVLDKFGFAVGFDSRKDGDVLFTIVVIRHIGGHEERPEFPFPWREPSKGRAAADEVSAALSKAQRHSFRKAFNILSLGEEEEATIGQRITEDQAMTIQTICAEAENREAGANGRVWRWIQSQFKVATLDELRQGEQLDAVMKHLDQLQKRLGMK